MMNGKRGMRNQNRPRKDMERKLTRLGLEREEREPELQHNKHEREGQSVVGAANECTSDRASERERVWGTGLYPVPNVGRK